jgi:UDP-glucose 4-epimerase
VTMNFWSPYGLRVHLGLYSLHMRILITGGFGFVGGRLAVHLAQEGHNIVLGTRKEVTAPLWLPQAKVSQIKWDDNEALESSCTNVDVVIHTAGMNAQECAASPVDALEFNGVATARLVAAACRTAVRRFIYFSTAHVYASPLVGTITEGTCPRNLHPYSSSHYAGESVVLSAKQRGQIEGIVLRLSNAFGAPVHEDVNCWTLLVNDLCRQAVTKRSFTLRSAGLQRRDFVALKDVCRAASHVLDLSKEHTGDGVFNIGGAWTPRVIDMAELIRARCSALLGFVPTFIRTVQDEGEATLDLDFQIYKLLASGFELSGNAVTEIDANLLFCNEAFGSDR